MLMYESRKSYLLVSTLLTIALGGWILTTALARTAGEPAQTQALLSGSGLYQAVIPQQVADIQAANSSLAGIPLDNPEVQKIIGTSLDSKRLETEGNKAVESVYAWLEGKTERPQIDIAVMADPTKLAEAAGDYAARYTATLPDCAPGQADYSALSANPLGATCRPPEVTPEVVRANVSSAVTSNPALGTSTQLTEDDVKLTNGKTIVESFDYAPVWYQRAQMLPLVLAISVIVMMLILLVVLRPTAGMRSAGKHFMSVGITLAVIAVALTWVIEHGYDYFVPKAENPNVGDALMELTNLFNAAYRDNIVGLGLYSAAIGLGLIAFAYLTGKLHRKPAVPQVTSNSSSSLSKAPTAVSFTPLTTTKSKTAKKKTTVKKKPAARKKANK